MSRSAVLGIIALLVLCLSCLWCGAPRIESELRAQSLSCLEEAGMAPTFLEVSGRDATLSGVAPSAETSARVESCLDEIEGLRVVHNGLTIAEPGSLGINTQFGELSFSGTVPTQEDHDALIGPARSLWGEDRVRDELTVDPHRTFALWPAGWSPLLAALHHARGDLDIELLEGKALVSGNVLSELARRRALGAVAAALPEFEVVDHLEIREPEHDQDRLQAALDALLHDKIVEFDSDSAELTAAGRELLDRVVEILETHEGAIEISGHTDSRAAPEYNLDLSRQRAETVADYLTDQGLAAERFTTVGFGESKPIASNATPEGQRHNRRTEFHVLREE